MNGAWFLEAIRMERPPCMRAHGALVGMLSLSVTATACGRKSSTQVDAGRHASVDGGVDAGATYSAFAAIIAAEQQELDATGIAMEYLRGHCLGFVARRQ